MSSGATKPASTPLFSPQSKQNILHQKGDWPFEFSAPGTLRVTTGPATRVRIPRTLRQVAVTASGEGGQITLNILKNGAVIFSPPNGVSVGSVSYTVEIPVLLGEGLSIQIFEIVESGLSNLWVGLA